MRLSPPRPDGNLHIRSERSNHPAPPSRHGTPHEPQFWIERVAWLPRIQKKFRIPGWIPTKPPKARRRKRAADLVLGAALVVFFAPLMAVIALAVCLDGGPMFYGHPRGRPNGPPFRCWKFRTMVVNADQVLQER